MKKTPNLFERDFTQRDNPITEIPNTQCDWVFAGEGIATRKIDGTSCMIKDEKLYKRREIKKGKPIPDNFVDTGVDNVTGKTVGWVLVTWCPEDVYHLEAFEKLASKVDGTYELIGPNIQGNPERVAENMLVRHGYDLAGPIDNVPRTYNELKQWMQDKDIEGVVFHHLDGRMAKIRLADFNIKRKI